MPTTSNNDVLCPELYDLVTDRIGTPRVINQGEAFNGTPWVDGFGKVMWNVHQAGEYYAVCCPFCNDTKYRLWINHQYGHVDEETGVTNWLAVCYNQEACLTGDDEDAQYNRQSLKDRIKGDLAERSLNFAIKPGREMGELFVVGPPGDLVRVDELSGQHPAVRYLSSDRGYDPVSLGRHWGVSYCVKADFQYRAVQDRIIIPIIMNGDWVGWQGRYVGEIDFKAANIRKYWNLPGFSRRRVLYNYDRAKNYNIVVLVEGVTSTWAVGDVAVGTLGTMTNYQRDMVINTWAKRGALCVIMFDPDATEKADKAHQALVRDFGKHGGAVIKVDLPFGRDPGSYTHEANWEIIRSTANQYGVDLDRYL